MLEFERKPLVRALTLDINGMESWPNSTSTTTHVSKSKKAKSQIQNSNASYPVVEYGGITSANLYHKTNHLKWTFLTGEETGESNRFSL